jgi:hypothetical protein
MGLFGPPVRVPGTALQVLSPAGQRCDSSRQRLRGFDRDLVLVGLAPRSKLRGSIPKLGLLVSARRFVVAKLGHPIAALSLSITTLGLPVPPEVGSGCPVPPGLPRVQAGR